MANLVQNEETQRLVLNMKARAEAAQVVVSEVADLIEALSYTTDLVQRRGGTTIAAPGLSGSELDQLRELCELKTLTLLNGTLRNHMENIHTAFTVANWGIAETGTIVLDSSSEDVRIATTLCEIHVAALPRSCIRPTAYNIEKELDDLMKRAPRFFAFISGASRTADIERVLTVGVHGPLEVHLLIVDHKDDA